MMEGFRNKVLIQNIESNLQGQIGELQYIETLHGSLLTNAIPLVYIHSSHAIRIVYIHTMTVLLIEPVVVRYGDDPQLCRGQYYLSGVAAEMVSEYCGLSGE